MTLPPAPPPPTFGIQIDTAKPNPPAFPNSGPPDSLLAELLIFNGYPFKDHWAYLIRAADAPGLGIKIHAAGDVRTGFEFQIERGHDLALVGPAPSTRVPLQWVERRFLGGDDAVLFNGGVHRVDQEPVCAFERSVARVRVPEKSLNSVADMPASGKRIIQRDCQTWIVESADQLVLDGIFTPEVAGYLGAIQQ